jgi:hypothetical protein
MMNIVVRADRIGSGHDPCVVFQRTDNLNDIRIQLKFEESVQKIIFVPSNSRYAAMSGATFVFRLTTPPISKMYKSIIRSP